ncbi:CCA-adding enzyme [Rubritalea halochordaticola]|uniref:CCA-adding enzyme n=2 Tax=Rubritalea halochordaticola TaxID=714537 RepID=A0ABP9UZF3_9BACT
MNGIVQTFKLDTHRLETPKFPPRKFKRDMTPLEDTAKSIAAELREAGHTAYFAGGCVRDALLGKDPKDYDIATSATPQEVMKLFPGSDAIGAHFGVILVRRGGAHFEIATFRNDGSYSDGRRPDSVTFSTPEEDAQRRDFTVNGLFKDPEKDEIIDFVGGQADLAKQTLRAIGDPKARFSEDALRLMRAIRFATVLGFEIETATWQAICDCHELLKKIAVERIREEFNKIILSPNRAQGVRMLVDSGLIQHFLPEVLDLIGCEQPPQWHPEGDVYTHTMIMLEMLHGTPSLDLCLSVLLHDIGKPATYTYDEEDERIRFNGHDRVGSQMSEEILHRLKYPNDTIEAVSAMVDNHMNFMHVQQMKKSKLKRFMARPNYQDEMELHRVDCASSNGFTENYEFLRQKEEEFDNEPLIPEPLVKGKDLIDMGFKPGPRFKEILEAIQTEQLEGSLTSREQGLAYVRENYEAE